MRGLGGGLRAACEPPTSTPLLLLGIQSIFSPMCRLFEFKLFLLSLVHIDCISLVLTKKSYARHRFLLKLNFNKPIFVMLWIEVRVQQRAGRFMGCLYFLYHFVMNCLCFGSG